MLTILKWLLFSLSPLCLPMVHAQNEETTPPVVEQPLVVKPSVPQIRVEEKKATKEDFVPFEERRQISLEYFQGPNLLFDCRRQHYACVDKVSYQRCVNRRQQSVAAKSDRLLPCAPLKEYKELKICLVELKKVVDLPRRRELCERDISTRADH